MSKTTTTAAGESPGKIALNTSLMWSILDFASIGTSADKQSHFFHQSFPSLSRGVSDQRGNTTVEDLSTPAVVMAPRPADDYAQPVDWFDAVTSPSERSGGIAAGPSSGDHLRQQHQDVNMTAHGLSFDPTAMALNESNTLIDMNEYPMMHFHDPTGGTMGYWGYGNL